jgi:toxin ParE1/3/4
LVITHYPYIVPYRIKSGCIEILRVFHTARAWPKQM